MTARAKSLLAVVVIFGLVALGVTARNAYADLSPKVIKAFKGQILISDEPLSPGATDKETIAAYKSQKKSSVKGEANAEDVTSWTFHYTAFLKRKGFSQLSLEFHSDGKYVADRRLEGIDTSLTVLEGDISITEDDGPAKGKKYTLKLVGTSKGKDVILATTTLTMN